MISSYHPWSMLLHPAPLSPSNPQSWKHQFDDSSRIWKQSKECGCWKCYVKDQIKVTKVSVMIYCKRCCCRVCTAVEACIKSPCCHYGAIAQWRLCWTDKLLPKSKWTPVLNFCSKSEGPESSQKKLSKEAWSPVQWPDCRDDNCSSSYSFGPRTLFCASAWEPWRLSFSPRIVIAIIKTDFKTKQHGAEQQRGDTS